MQTHHQLAAIAAALLTTLAAQSDAACPRPLCTGDTIDFVAFTYDKDSGPPLSGGLSMQVKKLTFVSLNSQLSRITRAVYSVSNILISTDGD